MDHEDDDDAITRARVNIMEQMEAEQRRLDQARNGVLWGAWSPNRIHCQTCKSCLVDADDQIAFLDEQEVFEHETLLARSHLLYDLMYRSSIDIPAWISSDTQFWMDGVRLESGQQPDDIRMMATVVGLGGETYGEYKRVCDEPNHVFVRECRFCGEPDPLAVSGEFSDAGLAISTPPHSFLETLRNEEQQKRQRADRVANRLSKMEGLSRQQILLLQSGIANADDVCVSCGSDELPNSLICPKCGEKFWNI